MSNETMNANLMVFLGAGASSALGMPTTLQFMEILKNNWKGYGTFIESYKKYTSSSNTSSNKNNKIDSEYIRDWILELRRAAVAMETISKNEPFNTNAAKIENSVIFIDAILRGFDSLVRESYTTVSPQAAYMHYAPLLESFKIHNLSMVPIFTTNYDLVFESMQEFDGCKFEIITGMQRVGTRVILDTKSYEKMATDNPCLLLYKLHGSTDWWMKRDTKEIQQIPTDLTVPTNRTELIIYPTREKFEQMKEKPFNFFYDALRQYLKSSNMKVCISIGYSFRDQFINQIFTEAISKGMHLEIIDSSPSGVSKSGFAEKYSNNIRMHQLEFGNWQQLSRERLKKILDAVFKILND